MSFPMDTLLLRNLKILILTVLVLARSADGVVEEMSQTDTVVVKFDYRRHPQHSST